MAVAGLLFVAFAVFAVGMAGAARNGTRSAADAAALAAAQSYRDQAYTGFLRDLTGRTGPPAGDWRRWLDGLGDAPATACREAERLARDNGAEPSGPGCAAAPGPDPASLAFDVTVVSRDAVGGSVVPGTENTHPTARSRAVVAPRCRPAADGGDQGPYARLDCDDGPWTVDPAHPDPRLTARTLFAVRLVATD